MDAYPSNTCLTCILLGLSSTISSLFWRQHTIVYIANLSRDTVSEPHQTPPTPLIPSEIVRVLGLCSVLIVDSCEEIFCDGGDGMKERAYLQSLQWRRRHKNAERDKSTEPEQLWHRPFWCSTESLDGNHACDSAMTYLYHRHGWRQRAAWPSMCYGLPPLLARIPGCSWGFVKNILMTQTRPVRRWYHDFHQPKDTVLCKMAGVRGEVDAQNHR